jgi:hypothetical protein
MHAPWTHVDKSPSAMWDPAQITTVIREADAVIDASGSSPLTEQVSRIAVSTGVLLASAALYRGGAICRIRRFRPGVDVPIHERGFANGFPLIPAGTEVPERTLELGCSAPVNNASPVAVVAAASLLTQVVIDGLAGRFDLPPEVVDVYSPLAEQAPFETPGRYFYG